MFLRINYMIKEHSGMYHIIFVKHFLKRGTFVNKGIE